MLGVAPFLALSTRNVVCCLCQDKEPSELVGLRLPPGTGLYIHISHTCTYIYIYVYRCFSSIPQLPPIKGPSVCSSPNFWSHTSVQLSELVVFGPLPHSELQHHTRDFPALGIISWLLLEILLALYCLGALHCSVCWLRGSF